jgi:hypothetical protein
VFPSPGETGYGRGAETIKLGMGFNPIDGARANRLIDSSLPNWSKVSDIAFIVLAIYKLIPIVLGNRSATDPKN